MPGGFFTTDDGLTGASPDFIVGTDGDLELKCPAPQTHVGYMVRRAIDEKYKPQVQGQLYVTEREWADLQSYHPQFPTVIIRIARDEEYIAEMASALREFVDVMLAARLFLEREYGPFKRIGEKRAEEQHPELGITDADVEAIVRAKFPQPEATV